MFMKKLIMLVIVLGLVFSIFFVNSIEGNFIENNTIEDNTIENNFIENNTIENNSKSVSNFFLSVKNKQSITYKQTGSSIKFIFLK